MKFKNKILNRAISLILCFLLVVTSLNISSVVENDIYGVSGDMLFAWSSSNNFNVKTSTIKTTYSDAGYTTALAVDGTEVLIKGSNSGVGTNNGVTLSTSYKSISDNNYIEVIYTVVNNNTVAKTIGIATYSDVMIGTNDYAPIHNFSGNRGFYMTDGTNNFNVLLRDSYGVSPNVDTYWYGHYSNRTTYKWQSGTSLGSGKAPVDYTDLSGIDSGMAFSWKDRTIAAGATQTYSFVIGVGELNNPPTIQLTSDIASSYYDGQTINVTGNLTDADASDTVGVRYTVDNGTEYSFVSGVTTNGGSKTFNGSFDIPSGFEEGQHTLTLWAVDSRGAMSTALSYNFQYKAAWLLSSPDNTTNNNKGSVSLDWSGYTESNNVFKGYQSTDGGQTWKSMSLMDYTSVSEVKVLNIYPDAGNNLKSWMDSFGKNIIKVTPVSMTEFNSNPGGYLYKSGGMWSYDVIVFGFWDRNNYRDVSLASRNIVEQFIDDGGGCIFGHDTALNNSILYTDTHEISGDAAKNGQGNFDYLARKYFSFMSYSNNYVGDTSVTITKTGLFTTYPWNIGDIGTTLTIPLAHTWGQYLSDTSNVWLAFGSTTTITAQNFYLVTNNNCAMIQTGHSKGAATEDEQKILANVIFYCYQLSEATTTIDYSAIDTTAPSSPTLTSSKNGNNNIITFSSSDNGTTYKYKIEAYSKNDLLNPLTTSNVSSSTVTSGISGYYYITDNNATNDFNIASATFVSSTSVNIPIGNSKYVHVKAVDKAGNVSAVKDAILQYNATYYVKHWQQKVGGNASVHDATNYTLVETETLIGVSNTSVTPGVKTYTKFKNLTPSAITISWDGTSVLNYYYELNPFNVTVDVRYENADGTFTDYSTEFTSNEYYYNDSFSWSKNANDTYKSANKTATITGDTTLQVTVYRQTHLVSVSGGTGISSVSGGGTYRVGQSVTVNASVLANTAQYTYGWTGWTGTYSSSSTSYTFTMPTKDVTLTANGTRVVNKYYLDLNGYLDSTSSSNTTDFGTFDVYINGVLISNDVSDFYTQYDYGTTFEVKDIRPTTGHSYNGVKSGSISGTITGTVSTQLNFTTNSYVITLNKGNGIASVSGGGTYKYGTTIEINATTSLGYDWDGWSGTYDATTQKYTFTVPAQDVIENATAKAHIYNISYELDGGSFGGNPAIQYTIESDTFTLLNSTKRGYTFVGWVGSNGNTASTSVSIAKGTTGDKSYTATWKINQYDVDYIDSVGSAGSLVQLGKVTKKINYNTVVNGNELGTNTEVGYYYTGYRYVSSTSATVDISGNKVYRVFQKVNITANSSGYSGIYDGSKHSITVSGVSPSDSVITYSTSENGTYSTTNPTYVNAGTYTIYYKISKTGYDTISGSEKIVIEKAQNPLSISNDSLSIVYPNKGTISVTSNLGGTVSVASSNLGVVTPTIVGTTITNVPGVTTDTMAYVTVLAAETANYKAASMRYSVVVKKGTLDVTRSDYVGVYDGNAHNISISSNGDITYQQANGSYGTVLPSYVDSGDYTTSWSISKPGYETVTGTNNVSISKAENELSLSGSSLELTYPNNGSFSITKNKSNGTLYVSSSNSSIASVVLSNNNVSVISGTASGTATITVTADETKNYNSVTKTFEVNVKKGTLVVQSSGYNGIYDNAGHSISVVSNPTGAITYSLVNGSGYSTTKPTKTDAGSYIIYYKVSKAGYNDYFGSDTVTIGKANGSITLAAAGGQILYPDETVKSVKITSNLSGGNVTAVSSNTKVATVSINNGYLVVSAEGAVGTTQITVTSAETNNYYAASTTYTFKVEYSSYNIYYADVIDSVDGTILGGYTATLKHGTMIRGEDMGSLTTDNIYYPGYYYTGVDTRATVNGSDVTVYRIFKLRTINIPVYIKWVDNSNKFNTRPDKISVALTNGYNSSAIETKNIDKNDNDTWTTSFANYPKYDSQGSTIPYTFTVIGITSRNTALAYNVSYNQTVKAVTSTLGLYVPSSSEKQYGVTIKGNVSWEDENDEYHFRPETTEVLLYRNDMFLKKITLDAKDTTYEFTGLDYLDDDEESDTYMEAYRYSVRESNVLNYNIITESKVETSNVLDSIGNSQLTDVYITNITNMFAPNEDTYSFPSYNELTFKNDYSTNKNEEATVNDFNSIGISDFDCDSYITLKQMNMTWVSKNANSGDWDEVYGSSYSGNTINVNINGYSVTKLQYLPYGKYEITFNDNMYNTIKTLSKNSIDNMIFTEENGKYYLTYSYKCDEKASGDFTIHSEVDSFNGYTDSQKTSSAVSIKK